MNWAKIKFLITDHPWIVLGIAVAIVVLLAWYCSSGTDRKGQQMESNIDVHKGEANVIGNLVTNQETEVNSAANSTNQALGNLANSVNRDSSTFNGNSTNRFCERFPNDSTCAEWRKAHGR